MNSYEPYTDNELINEISDYIRLDSMRYDGGRQ